MTGKQIVLLGFAAVALLLLWSLIGLLKASSVPQDPRQQHKEGVVVSTSSIPALESNSFPGRVDQQQETEPKPTAAPDQLDAATAPPAGLDQLWGNIESTSTALFNGTATFEEICRVSKDLLSNVDVKSASRRADGATVYRIQDHPDLGTATLVVNPNRAGTVEQYELTVEKKLASGYTGSPSDIEGSRLRIHFGDAGKGEWGFGANVEDKLRTGDESTWSANANAGLLNIGGSLFSKGSDIYKHQVTAQAIRLPEGTPGWKIGYGATTRELVEQNGLSGQGLPELQSKLTTLGKQ